MVKDLIVIAFEFRGERYIVQYTEPTVLATTAAVLAWGDDPAIDLTPTEAEQVAWNL